jgi:arginine deiminase
MDALFTDALSPGTRDKLSRDRSRSFSDVAIVEGGHVASPPPLKRIRSSKRESMLNGTLRAVQEHEDELAECVIVCEPEGSSLMMGGLHPRGSLYERPVNIDTAKAQHANFRQVLRDHGVRVLTVREILAYGVEEHMGARTDLEALAMEGLTYRLAAGVADDQLADGDRHYLSDDYKRTVIEHMSITQLIDIILINPTVHLTPSYRDTGLTASYTFEPLSNLVYTRDQQITTCKGIVMGRLRSLQRQNEVEVMKFCFNKLGRWQQQGGGGVGGQRAGEARRGGGWGRSREQQQQQQQTHLPRGFLKGGDCLLAS